MNFLWPLCLMSIGIKLSQEYCLSSCRETQPFTDATRLCFFHLETESKGTHKIIKANQFPLPHVRTLWCLVWTWIIPLQSKFVGKHRFENVTLWSFFQSTSQPWDLPWYISVNPDVRIQKIDDQWLFYLLPRKKFTGNTPRLLGGEGEGGK